MKTSFHQVGCIVLAFFFIQSCTVNNVTVDDSIEKYFKNHHVEGTFGMFDNSRGSFTIYNLDRFKQPFPPGESFMIFSKLVGVHTGKIASDTIQIDFNSLNQMIGKDTMQFWVDSVKYGNKKWKQDSITISPDEQLGLIKRLYFKQLPFRSSVQEAIKKSLLIENNAQYQLAYQKTSLIVGNKKTSWIMGWIEENRHVYPFVINYTSELDSDTSSISTELCKEILQHIGFFKGIM